MTNELARREVLAPAPSGMTPAEVDVVKQSVCRGASDEELRFFLAVCDRTGLNPLLKQIHGIKRWNSQEKRETLTVQVGIDGFRLIADRTGRYVPGREPEFTYDANGRVVSATAYVKKMVAGEWHEIAATAYYEEYAQRNKDGEPNQSWRTMPRVMLSKCAEAIAIRKAFPAETSGVYSPEEMSQADNPAPAPAPRPTVRETPRQALPQARTIDAGTGEVIDNAPRPRSPKRGVAEDKMATLLLELLAMDSVPRDDPEFLRFTAYDMAGASDLELKADLDAIRALIAKYTVVAPDVEEEEAVVDPFADQ